MNRLRQLAAALLILTLLTVGWGPTPQVQAQKSITAPTATAIFINELHYDNSGADTGEALEVAAPTITDLTGWSVVLYNGSGGAQYATLPLGSSDGTCGDYSLYVLSHAGIQNGSPDGMALVDDSGTVIQFLSYEGAFTATDGPANGLVSTDIGVSEDGSGNAADSLQLSGTGTNYSDFTWQSDAANTFGACNNGQTFASGDVAPTVATTVPSNGTMDVALDSSITITFTEPVTVTTNWFQVECAASGTFTATNAAVTGGPTAFTIDPNTDLTTSDVCTGTVYADQVTDQDVPLDTMASDYVWTFYTVEACQDPYTYIYDVQGDGAASPMVGDTVSVEGIVVGDFQNNGEPDNGDLYGFHIQDPTGDGDPTTSDGIFVYYTGATDVKLGDVVRVRGKVSEYNGLTELGANMVQVCSPGHTVAPTAISLPVDDVSDFEPYEGMLVTFPQALTISEYYNFGRYGEIVLTSQRQYQPTAVYDPGSSEGMALMADNLLDRITLDDGRTSQNPDPAIHPNGDIFTNTNLFRGGDTVADVTGVMDYSHSLYRIQPIEGADYTKADPRPAEPEDVGGTLKVASLNVLNYFTTIDTGAWICGPSQDMECRGADTAEELVRQRAKIVAALQGIDADIVGLMEIENGLDDGPTADLVAGLNDALGASGTYTYVATGPIGTDAIRQALIYDEATVTPLGDFAVLDTSVDETFSDTLNRPALAQAFKVNASDAIFTVAVNHLKSKGGTCPTTGGDSDQGDGAGCYNAARTAAAEALVNWLATDPTGSGDPDALIIGDLNSYDKEDPIDALLAGGYTDLLGKFQGEYAYSYVFDGQLGYLDYSLASSTLATQVTGATAWHINADEPSLIDYDMTYKQPAQDAIYAPDAYRSSDHDPVIIGLDFSPQITVTKSVAPMAPSLNDVVTYTVTLSNTGGLSDTVSLTDTLPAETTFAYWVDQPAGAAMAQDEITWTGTMTQSSTLTFSFAVTNTTPVATVTNTAVFSGTLQTGSASAVYVTARHKLWMPLIFQAYSP